MRRCAAAVAVVVVLKDGRAFGLRATDADVQRGRAAPLAALPGQPLARERLPTPVTRRRDRPLAVRLPTGAAKAAQPATPSSIALGRRRENDEPDRVVAGAVHEERAADRRRSTRARAHARAARHPSPVRQRRPDEEAALRRRPASRPPSSRARTPRPCIALARGTARAAAAPAVEHAAAHGLVDDALIEDAATQVGGLLGGLETFDERRRRHHPADAEARRQRLGERARDRSRARADRPRGSGASSPADRHVLEVQRAVGIVFDDQHVTASAHSTSARGVSSVSSAPVGFWKFGTT